MATAVSSGWPGTEIVAVLVICPASTSSCVTTWLAGGQTWLSPGARSGTAQVSAGSKNGSVIVAPVSVTLPSLVTARVNSTVSPAAENGPSWVLVKVLLRSAGGPATVTGSEGTV